MAGNRSRRLITAFAISPLLAVAVSACGGGSSSGSSSAGSTARPHTKSSAVTISTAGGTDGVHLVGASKRSVYLWGADKGTKSTCAGACAGNWPPVITKGSPNAGAGTSGADLGTTRRSDGSEQVTYNGHPLYYYIGDQTAGATSGQGSDGFGARWWLVAPSGHAITPASASSGGSAGSSSGSGGGNGY